jgi:hypothetical protein
MHGTEPADEPRSCGQVHCVPTRLASLHNLKTAPARFDTILTSHLLYFPPGEEERMQHRTWYRVLTIALACGVLLRLAPAMAGPGIGRWHRTIGSPEPGRQAGCCGRAPGRQGQWGVEGSGDRFLLPQWDAPRRVRRDLA